MPFQSQSTAKRVAIGQAFARISLKCEQGSLARQVSEEMSEMFYSKAFPSTL